MRPSRRNLYSDAIGSLTLTIISARDQTAAAELTISAPALTYSSSVMPDPSPALVSTSTLWPPEVSALTPAGINPTRYSLSLTSFGRPTIIILLESQWSVIQSLPFRVQRSGFKALCNLCNPWTLADNPPPMTQNYIEGSTGTPNGEF